MVETANFFLPLLQYVKLALTTGSGKTVVGLIILQSCLNEGLGPAVYVTPDNYLLNQVIDEANQLGIEVTKDHESPRFLSGEAVLVVNIFKVVNGRSVFGIDTINIDIGSIVIDDAHASLDTVQEQFTLSISNSNPAYKQLFSLFKNDLLQQYEARATDVEIGDPHLYLQLPFWTWQNKQADIARIIIENKNHDEIKFKWPLIRDALKLSRCIISSKAIEISPHCIPINIIPSLYHAKRKVFMSATLSDDSILTTHFDVAEDPINSTVFPNSAGDIGDRVILIPQASNPSITDEDLKSLCVEISKDRNVVIIVPSAYRANFWKDNANLILNRENLNSEIKKFKNGQHAGLIVLINRYDGIDLPFDSCRLLVIDDLPNTSRLIDNIENDILAGSDRYLTQVVQKVEQGMGRGIRANSDYCAVLLMGKSLTRQLFSRGAINNFSPSTLAQIRLSNKLSEQIKTLDDVKEILNLFYNRDDGWVSQSKRALTSLIFSVNKIDEISLAQRQAFNLAIKNQFSDASTFLNNLVNKSQDKSIKAYLQQQLAEYINLYDPSTAQQILLAATRDSHKTLKPITGISYHKLDKPNIEQAHSCSKFIQKFNNPNKLLIEINFHLGNLVFSSNTSNSFEESISQLAKFLGFNSHRPEKEYGKGPDVLWRIGNLDFLVIECKNEATTETIKKGYCNQLNGSSEWFVNQYDQSCTHTPIMVHPSIIFEHAASPKQSIRILNDDKLELLKFNVNKFFQSICTQNKIDDENFIRTALIQNKLRSQDLIMTYTSGFKIKP